MDQDQMESVKVFDPANKCHFRVVLPNEKFSAITKIVNIQNEEDSLTGDQPCSNFTTWNQTETLALINIFSLFKDKFKNFKKRREQWNLISEELAKIGIHKIPEKCEIKWKNLLRVYRQHKIGNKGQGKFEFFNELDDIIANDQQFNYIIGYPSNTAPEALGHTSGGSRKVTFSQPEKCNSSIKSEHLVGKRLRCGCVKTEKQKRHEDRMVIMRKKMEIEERKVTAFEEYLQFLKSNTQKT
ncbi:hypothetical protein NQ318_002695 [Aromia moschata]|uniref:Myb-like domain-containing protein n=1 Tax=Aromia moschata TaxID=1265417 RepID=A0AAV8Y2Z5_9CUCU|nr:hypothetical protein NQ318_002695 [Aromia moschata]